MKRAAVIVAFFGSLILIWQLAAMSGRWSPVLLPPPAAIADYLWGAMSDGSLLEATAVTLYRLLIGYAIGLLLGLPLGLLTSTSEYFEDTIGALALGLQTLPSVCWVPLALLWFGQTDGAMLFVVVMGTVWWWSLRPTPAPAASRRSTRAPRAPWDRRASTSGFA